MNIKTVSLAVVVFASLLLTVFYFNHGAGHGHAHGPEIQEADKANSTTHETIN
jgi:hypothetical protein